MKKLFNSVLLVLALLATTTGTVFAQESTPISGTIESVVLESDTTTGESIVIVTVLDEFGASQTVNLSLETAESLGLVTTDPTTGEPVVDTNQIGATVEIDPATILPDETTEEDEHPAGSALSDFFSEMLGVDYETIMTYHDDGVGFGVIAQALWLTNNLEGDTATFEALLDAKQSGDYDAITLADGSTPNNWGDVVKSLKKGGNLGNVMSGKTDKNEDTTAETSDVEHGNGNGNNGNNKGDKEKGNGNNNGNGGGKP